MRYFFYVFIVAEPDSWTSWSYAEISPFEINLIIYLYLPNTWQHISAYQPPEVQTLTLRL